MVDKDATDEAKAAYAYLKSIGKSEYVIFGHQNATWHKAGNNELSSSDTQDITGTNPGIIGID
ncbi:glycosyl hydrolase, partial [Acinetobacter sp. 163]|nr:glycosyl hydrolase [Acinetobacter sp. 163]